MSRNSQIASQPVKARAVAIRHQAEADPTPRITAAGVGKDAEDIVALALQSGVRVREDRDLAEVLSSFEIDSLVPLEALRAVAEVLSYVYLANNQMAEKQASLAALRQTVEAGGKIGDANKIGDAKIGDD
jgi:flagellar biosynthesis protein